MKYHVLAVYLFRKYHAVLVVAGDPRSVTDIALRCEKIVGGYQADARSGRRIARVCNCVQAIVFDPRDARILCAPFLVRLFARNGGAVPYLVDSFTVRRERQGKASNDQSVLC